MGEIAVGHERRGHQAHGLLRVVGAVGEGQTGRGRQLAPRTGPSIARVALRSDRRARRMPSTARGRATAEDKKSHSKRAEHAHGPQAVQPAPTHGVQTALGQGRPGQGADQAVARAAGQAPPQGDQVPDQGAEHRRGQDLEHLGGGNGDDAGDGGGHGRPHHQRADHMEDGGEDHRRGRPDGAGDDGRGDGVAGIVDAVDHREGCRQRHHNQDHGGDPLMARPVHGSRGAGWPVPARRSAVPKNQPLSRPSKMKRQRYDSKQPEVRRAPGLQQQGGSRDSRTGGIPDR